MNTIVTGIMAGMQTEEYLQKVVKFGEAHNTKIKVYDVFQRICARKNTTIDRLLDMHHRYFSEIRRSEYLKIALEMERDKETDHNIIKTHSTAEWGMVTRTFQDNDEISQLNPDTIVTLLDAEWHIRDRLLAAKQGNDKIFGDDLREHPEERYLDYILDWTHSEFEKSESWAKQISREKNLNPETRWEDFIPDYVLACGQAPESLYKLATIPNVPVFYASYSMTHSDAKVRKKVDEGIKRLKEYGVVMDPQAIEIDINAPDDLNKTASDIYAVVRDIEYIVDKLRQGKKNAVVAFHPYDKKAPFTSGMPAELLAARDTFVTRMLVMPQGKSPFTRHSLASPGCLFKDNEELFSHMESMGYEKLNL